MKTIKSLDALNKMSYREMRKSFLAAKYDVKPVNGKEDLTVPVTHNAIRRFVHSRVLPTRLTLLGLGVATIIGLVVLILLVTGNFLNIPRNSPLFMAIFIPLSVFLTVASATAIIALTIVLNKKEYEAAVSKQFLKELNGEAFADWIVKKLEHRNIKTWVTKQEFKDYFVNQMSQRPWGKFSSFTINEMKLQFVCYTDDNKVDIVKLIQVTSESNFKDTPRTGDYLWEDDYEPLHEEDDYYDHWDEPHPTLRKDTTQLPEDCAEAFNHLDKAIRILRILDLQDDIKTKFDNIVASREKLAGIVLYLNRLGKPYNPETIHRSVRDLLDEILALLDEADQEMGEEEF